MLANFMQMLDPVYDEFEHQGQQVQAPVWPLDGDEAKKLGIATAAYLETMPQKARVRELLEKHLPLFVFCGTIGEVFGPRAQFSIDKKRKATIAKLEAANNRRIGRIVQPGTHAHAESQSAEGTTSGTPGHDARPRHEGDALAHAFTDAA